MASFTSSSTISPPAAYLHRTRGGRDGLARRVVARLRAHARRHVRQERGAEVVHAHIAPVEAQPARACAALGQVCPLELTMSGQPLAPGKRSRTFSWPRWACMPSAIEPSQMCCSISAAHDTFVAMAS